MVINSFFFCVALWVVLELRSFWAGLQMSKVFDVSNNFVVLRKSIWYGFQMNIDFFLCPLPFARCFVVVVGIAFSVRPMGRCCNIFFLLWNWNFRIIYRHLRETLMKKTQLFERHYRHHCWHLLVSLAWAGALGSLMILSSSFVRLSVFC